MLNNKNFDKLSSFQESLHTPNGNGKNEEICSPFSREFIKSTYYNHYSESMRAQKNNSNLSQHEAGSFNNYIFSPTMKPHALLYSHFVQYLPSIECNPGYRANWIKNIGTNIIVEAQFIIDGQIIQTIDSKYIDYLNIHLKSNERQDFDLSVGNIDILQKPSEKLPSFETDYLLPFFYSKKMNTYFPLHRFGHNQEIHHSLKTRKDISSLVVVWNEKNEVVPFDSNSIKRINGRLPSENSYELPLPKVHGEYANLTDYDCNEKYCSNSLNSCDIIHIEDIIVKCSENPIQLGKKCPIKTETISYPVTKIIWLAQNLTAVEKYNDYSNYSTQSNRVSDDFGWSPTSSATFTTTSCTIFKDYPIILSQRIGPKMQLGKIPCESGYNSFCLGLVNDANIPSPGKIINGGQLSVDMKDMNPYLEFDEFSKLNCKDEFNVYAILVHQKRITLSQCPKNDSERPTAKTLVTISGEN